MSAVDWSVAPCRDEDPELFFPAAERGPEANRQIAAAKAVCNGCPILAECRAWALDALPHGVAGGMSAKERTAARNGRRARTYARPTAPAASPPPTVREYVPADIANHSTRSRGAVVIPAAIAALTDGVPRRDVAEAFGVTYRTVERWDARRRARAGTRPAAAGARS